MKKTIRKIFFIWLTIIVYFFAMYFWFWETHILKFLLYSSILFILTHFFAIEFQKQLDFRKYLILHIWLIIFRAIIFGFNNSFLILSIFFFHFGLFFLLTGISWELTNRKYIFTRAVSNAWMPLFIMWLTFSIWSLFLALFQKFPLTCDTLYSFSQKAVDQVKIILHLKPEATDKVKTTIQKTQNQTITQILWINFNNIIKTNNTNQTLPKNYTEIDKIWNNEIYLQQNKWLLWYIEKRKQKLVDNVIKDNKKVNKSICDFLIEQISSKFNNPAFKYSALFLIFILLIPFVRIFYYLLSFIVFLIFQILILFKVYSFEKELIESEILN